MPESLLENTLNTRELGGYRTEKGGYTKYDRLLRSDMQKNLSGRDIAYLSDRQITTIIDMRGEADVKKTPSPFLRMTGSPHFHYYNIPIEEGSRIPESVEAVPHSYMKIATAANITQVFRQIAHAPEGVLFHCSAGKDRTGVVSALLLLLARVGDGDIIENYMLTKEYNRERLQLLHQNFPEIDMNIVIPREQFMVRFLELFREAYGDVETYLQAEEIRGIKDKLLG